MDIKEKIKSIEDFKKEYQKQEKQITYQDFDKYFYVENYFYNSKLPFLKEKFHEILMEIIANIIKNYIQELEYYTNIKPANILMQSDLEILSKQSKETKKFYLQMHIYYKQYHQLHLKRESNTPKILELLKEVFPTIKKFNEYSIKLQSKLIENLKNKITENDKKEKESKHESSIFH